MEKLNNVSIQTLRYYDKVDIFKPEYVNPDNRYRYYSVKQICDLDIIKYLKHIGAPLEEIRRIIKLPPESMCEFLDKQELIIDEQIQKLSDTKKLLAHEFGVVYTRKIDERSVLKVDCKNIVTPLDQHKINFRGLAIALEKRRDCYGSSMWLHVSFEKK